MRAWFIGVVGGVLATAGCGGTAGYGNGDMGITLVSGCASAAYGGDASSCAVRKSDGQLLCWRNVAPPAGAAPRPMPGIVSPKLVRFFGARACAILADGTVSCWTDGSDGKPAQPPTPQPGYADAVDLTLMNDGNTHETLCAVTRDGHLLCDYEGGSPRSEGFFGGQVVQLRGSITAGCELLTDGSIQCWDLEPPVAAVTSGAVALGGSGLCYLDSAGAVSCGSPRGPFQPVLGDVAQLDDSQSCARKRDGSLWCWSGDGGATPPSAVETAQPGSTLSISGACGLFQGGGVYCWGSSSGNDASSPRLVTTLCN